MKILLSSFMLVALLLFCGCVKTSKLQSVKETKSLLVYGEENLTNLKKLSQKKDGFSVRFFGDSHIATDDVAEGFRNTFLKPNSIGFALPLQPKYHTNNLLKYESNGFSVISSQNSKNRDFPMCGVIATSKQKGSNIALSLMRQTNEQMVFEILYKSKDSGEILAIKDASGKQKIIKNSIKNSWNKQNLELNFPLKIEALKKDVMIGGYKIYKKNGARYADICGINGANSTLYKKWRDGAFDDFNYDMVVIGYGTNDAFDNNMDEQKFYANMLGLIKITREKNPNTLIVLLSPPVVEKPKFKAVQEAIKRLAINESLIFYDIKNFMDKTGGKDGWIDKELSKKDVHLTRAGYKKVGENLGYEIRNILGDKSGY